MVKLNIEDYNEWAKEHRVMYAASPAKAGGYIRLWIYPGGHTVEVTKANGTVLFTGTMEEALADFNERAAR